MSKQSYLEILGFENGVNSDRQEPNSTEIDKAYKKLALIYHPDKFKGTDQEKAIATEHFKAISDAHDKLRDPNTIYQDHQFTESRSANSTPSANSRNWNAFREQFNDPFGFTETPEWQSSAESARRSARKFQDESNQWFEAAKNGDVNTIGNMLKAGHNVNDSSQGPSALYLALGGGPSKGKINNEMVDLLLSQGTGAFPERAAKAAEILQKWLPETQFGVRASDFLTKEGFEQIDNIDALTSAIINKYQDTETTGLDGAKKFLQDVGGSIFDEPYKHLADDPLDRYNKQKIDVENPSSYNRVFVSPLMMAAQYGDLELVQKIHDKVQNRETSITFQ